mmetsp:Transcript_61393/g.168550  ORF Transcript_61393/g.168550 Transcript_61393/m.168550 type:complete len:230 (+) Transcript_61393:1418-2107(+)
MPERIREPRHSLVPNSMLAHAASILSMFFSRAFSFDAATQVSSMAATWCWRLSASICSRLVAGLTSKSRPVILMISSQWRPLRPWVQISCISGIESSMNAFTSPAILLATRFGAARDSPFFSITLPTLITVDIRSAALRSASSASTVGSGSLCQVWFDSTQSLTAVHSRSSGSSAALISLSLDMLSVSGICSSSSCSLIDSASARNVSCSVFALVMRLYTACTSGGMMS